MFTLLFIAMLIAVTIAWFLIQRLQDRPWTEYGVIPGSQDDLTSNASKVGLWAFLGVVTSMFLVFTGAYFMRFREQFEAWEDIPRASPFSAADAEALRALYP